jgi:hypothetical protein
MSSAAGAISARTCHRQEPKRVVSSDFAPGHILLRYIRLCDTGPTPLMSHRNDPTLPTADPQRSDKPPSGLRPFRCSSCHSECCSSHLSDRRSQLHDVNRMTRSWKMGLNTHLWHILSATHLSRPRSLCWYIRLLNGMFDWYSAQRELTWLLYIFLPSIAKLLLYQLFLLWIFRILLTHTVQQKTFLLSGYGGRGLVSATNSMKSTYVVRGTR